MVSLHRGVIKTHCMWLECWNIVIMEYWEKWKCCQFKNIKMNLNFIKLITFCNP
jgi:hypothetical protein